MHLKHRVVRLEVRHIPRPGCAVCGEEENTVVIHPPGVAGCMADLREHRHQPEFCAACGRQRVFVAPAPSLATAGV